MEDPELIPYKLEAEALYSWREDIDVHVPKKDKKDWSCRSIVPIPNELASADTIIGSARWYLALQTAQDNIFFLFRKAAYWSGFQAQALFLLSRVHCAAVESDKCGRYLPTAETRQSCTPWRWVDYMTDVTPHYSFSSNSKFT